MPDQIAATRSAYLFFSLVGFFIAIILFVLHLINIVGLGFFNKLPWSLISLATDLLWLIPTFVLAIVVIKKNVYLILCIIYLKFY